MVSRIGSDDRFDEVLPKIALASWTFAGKTERLQERSRRDNSPVWPQMLAQLEQNRLPLPMAPSAFDSAISMKLQCSIAV